MGVGRQEIQPLLAQALGRLGTRRAIVVHGLEGLDEVSLSGPTRAAQVSSDGVHWFQWEPADFGVSTQPMDELVVEGPEHSAEVIRGVLAGRRGPARDVVILNAAAACGWPAEPNRPSSAPAWQPKLSTRAPPRDCWPAWPNTPACDSHPEMPTGWSRLSLGRKLRACRGSTGRNLPR